MNIESSKHYKEDVEHTSYSNDVGNIVDWRSALHVQRCALTGFAVRRKFEICGSKYFKSVLIDS